MLTRQRKRELEVVYTVADYSILLPQGILTLKIGQYDPAADERLSREAGVLQDWTIITPCNPRSERAREEINLFYFNELRYELDDNNQSWFKAINHDPEGKWEDEPGFLISNLSLEKALNLGSRFLQNAIVFGTLGQAPRLAWITGGPEQDDMLV